MNWLAPGLVLVILLVGLTACQPSIEVVQDAEAPLVPPATVVPAARDVSVIGVDFDPPLDYAQILSQGGVTLLVLVSNRGQLDEPDLSLTARLVDPTDHERPATLLYETVAVGPLAPGELRVVRFSQVTDLPVRPVYSLVLELEGVEGDQDSSDNRRTYEIVVKGVE